MKWATGDQNHRMKEDGGKRERKSGAEALSLSRGGIYESPHGRYELDTMSPREK